MDDIVKQAMAKWPNVPDCFGWLGLDNRGQWCLRDDAAQAAGAIGHAYRGVHHRRAAQVVLRHACQHGGDFQADDLARAVRQIITIDSTTMLEKTRTFQFASVPPRKVQSTLLQSPLPLKIMGSTRCSGKVSIIP